MSVSNVQIISSGWSGAQPARQFGFRVRATITNDSPYPMQELLVSTDVYKVVGGTEYIQVNDKTLNLVSGTTYETGLITIGETQLQPTNLLLAKVSALWKLKRDEIDAADDDHVVEAFP